jgi:hypothetical protein
MFVGHLRLMEDTPEAMHLVGKTHRTTPHPVRAYAVCGALRSGADLSGRWAVLVQFRSESGNLGLLTVCASVLAAQARDQLVDRSLLVATTEKRLLGSGHATDFGGIRS